MKRRKRFSRSEASQVGKQLGVNFRRIPLAQWHAGMNVELEHGTRGRRTNVTSDDPRLTGKIAWAHLNEMPDYYTRLAKMEREGVHRRNPLTELARMGFKGFDETYLAELEAQSDQIDLDRAGKMLSDWTGRPESTVRGPALYAISEHVRAILTNRRNALRWLTDRDPRLGVWCAAQVARWALALVREREKPGAEPTTAQALDVGDRTIKAVEGWVLGRVTPKQVNKLVLYAERAIRSTRSASARAAIRSAAYAAEAVALASTRSAEAIYAAAETTADAADAAAAVAPREVVGVVADAVLTFPARRIVTKERSRPRKNPAVGGRYLVTSVWRSTGELITHWSFHSLDAARDYARQLAWNARATNANVSVVDTENPDREVRLT